ncbi:MAG: hypothetical protein DRH90_10605 [Deltaproteobacteria bacterium]|nr:MAG: hypothetical protein DRH90_10605 [Deltaproteobacteria bacterium]RLC14074.1 MAG: hypothetical protein DRI24_14305 [Deltaproteobacteria bacterium]
MFLRYQGCPVCQMEMANLKREFELFAKKETKVFAFVCNAGREHRDYIPGRVA